MKYFIILSLLIVLIQAQPGVYINSGLFVGLGSNFLTSLANENIIVIQDYANSYKINDISGSSGDIKYKITGITQKITLKDMSYTQYTSNQYAIGFNTVTLDIKCRYQVCYHKFLTSKISICESGDVEISSSSTNSISTNMTIDFSSASNGAIVKSTGTSLAGSISYNVHCTDKICAKTGEIKSKIESEFVPNVQTSITNAINAESSKFQALLPALRKMNYETASGYEFDLESQGILVESTLKAANPLIPDLILNLQGGVVLEEVKTGSLQYPTSSNSFKPSSSSIQDFTSDISLILTPYLMESMTQAVLTSSLPITITPNEVPASSPVTLNTSDPFFLQSVPGLSAYPNQGITVEILDPVTPNVLVNSSGITLNGTELRSNFIFNMGDKSQEVGFSIIFTLNAEFKLSLDLLHSGDVNITATLETLYPSASVVGTYVGDVDTTGFIQLIQLLQSVIQPKTFTIKNPTKYSITSLDLSYGEQFVQLVGDLSTSTTIKSNTIKFN